MELVFLALGVVCWVIARTCHGLRWLAPAWRVLLLGLVVLAILTYFKVSAWPIRILFPVYDYGKLP